MNYKITIKKLTFTLLFISLCLFGCSKDTTTHVSSKNPGIDEIETNNNLSLNDIVYTFDDGTSITVENLLTPTTLYNNICMTGQSENISFVYPESVLDFVIKSYSSTDVDSYVEQLYTLYSNIYNKEFTMENSFVSCQLLNDEQINDFIDFYANSIGASVLPEYAFIVESVYTISYKDKDGDEYSDSATDYYIAYFIDGQSYLDYYYIDTLDL